MEKINQNTIFEIEETKKDLEAEKLKKINMERNINDYKQEVEEY